MGDSLYSNAWILGRRALGLLAFHDHLSAIVKFPFVPVGAVELVWLPSGWTSRDVRRGQRVVCASLARAGFALAAFGMCHDRGIISSLSMRSNGDRCHHFLLRKSQRVGFHLAIQCGQ